MKFKTFSKIFFIAFLAIFYLPICHANTFRISEDNIEINSSEFQNLETKYSGYLHSGIDNFINDVSNFKDFKIKYSKYFTYRKCWEFYNTLGDAKNLVDSEAFENSDLHKQGITYEDYKNFEAQQFEDELTEMDSNIGFSDDFNIFTAQPRPANDGKLKEWYKLYLSRKNYDIFKKILKKGNITYEFYNLKDFYNYVQTKRISSDNEKVSIINTREGDGGLGGTSVFVEEKNGNKILIDKGSKVEVVAKVLGSKKFMRNGGSLNQVASYITHTHKDHLGKCSHYDSAELNQGGIQSAFCGSGKSENYHHLGIKERYWLTGNQRLEDGYVTIVQTNVALKQSSSTPCQIFQNPYQMKISNNGKWAKSKIEIWAVNGNSDLTGQAVNSDSLISYLVQGNTLIIIPGDADCATTMMFLNNLDHKIFQSIRNIMIVTPHHGSNTSVGRHYELVSQLNSYDKNVIWATPYLQTVKNARTYMFNEWDKDHSNGEEFSTIGGINLGKINKFFTTEKIRGKGSIISKSSRGVTAFYVKYKDLSQK